MSSYVVLARKWRPARFSDIVGQGHIIRTLMNAIRAQRVHQAYLFTGSRGIGKTSIARIFAKVLRCENTKSEGDWLHSCDQCSNCKEIAAGSGVDVTEIDGASNNGVEAVREIRENVKYMPATGSRKIYIIDEVHMLTTAAFNALLKTLEEPPPHVLFVFATTEPHKIPATILSRCQRFDFKRVTVAQIHARLTEVTKAEKIQAESAALALIAKAAEGSMRDALSLLDQVIAFSENKITAQAVRESTGLVEGQALLGILSAVFAKKPLDALAIVAQAYEQGHDLRVLTKNLIEFLHAAVLAKIGAAQPSDFEAEEWKELAKACELRPLEEIELIFQVLHHGLDWIARSSQPKIVLDILLVKCATAEALIYAADAAPVSTAGSLTTPVTAPAAKPQPMAQSTEGVSRSWEGLIAHIKVSRPLLASILEHGTCAPENFSNDATVLAIHFKPEDSYFNGQLQSRVYQEQLNALTKEYFAKPMRIQVEIKESGESLAERKTREAQEREKNSRASAKSHPMIVEAQSLFGGELGAIEVFTGEPG